VPETDKLLELTGEIVSAYVLNNSTRAGDLAGLIASVRGALRGAGAPVSEPNPKLVPRIPIKKSVTPDFIISLEDGKPYKSLKRHLGKHGLTADEYRAKWSLPADYPMVAPNYAKHRSELARAAGLGQKGAAKKKAPSKAGKRNASA
jgi:predicted transcriptional regulator